MRHDACETSEGDLMSDQSITPNEPRDDGRERVIWLAMVGLGILVTAIVLGLGWGVIGGRLAGARRIDEAKRTLNETAVVMNELDTVLRSGIDTDTVTRATQEIEKITPALERVEAIPPRITEYSDKITDDERRQAAVVIEAATAQADVFREGAVLLRQLEPAWSVREVVDPAWDATLAADKTAGDSVRIFEQHTVASVQRASKMNSRAKNAYVTTRSWFQGAADKLPVVNFSGYVDYITQRMKALELAQRANKAWLGGAGGAADGYVSAYREKEAKLGLQLQIFPARPSMWIDTSFEQQLDLPTSPYASARQKAQRGLEQLKGF